MNKLFAVVLGGAAPKSNIELHDVVFTVAQNIEETYMDLLDLWFGLPQKMHIDSYMVLDIVDGYEVQLKAEASTQKEKLFFINFGAYKKGDFMEHHANTFIVSTSVIEAKRRAKEQLLKGYDEVHKDDLYEIDDLLELKEVKGYHVHLKSTDKEQNLLPINGYHVLPKAVVREYLEQHNLITD
ncbi:DUF1543 domain-containing protein [Marivirga sp. S37H4]|uniref:DUF1543 domain-containing protein n=1 Tax=Marivirga aurantiaca TaxID=2802615 RepID=A0A934X0I4_9BACT|nr:DUF1543 domain-containing protein [Marivirga aurantiaca]MBK6266654.1 DUF1543 domain-containing protein [Marivirga aurantiaca]